MTNTSEIIAAQKAQSIFEQALDLPQEERLSFIETQCASDAELFAQVKLLLENELSGAGFLEHLYGTPDEPEKGFTLLGQTLGVYQLTEKLGRGGMAEVYLAHRTDGVYENQVAVKVIQGLGHNPNLVSRFHRERKILANLKHPNIAQLLDGGSTETGLPYFVMEYVEGERIDTYCAQHHLTVRERLKLFLKVCSAVTFAHRNLVIHRDLKPANILVDKQGEPKLLDFGIAKLLDQDKEQDETVTLMAMTPHYASPEQLRGEVLTTASDVYSLGLLLYELLAGTRANKFMHPIQAKYQQDDATSNILPPSKAVLAATENEKENETIAASNADRATAKKLSRALQGDLDTIVLKLLRHEPERRYDSVQALADDIERYLMNLPVLARKDSLWYRAHRYIRRNAAMISVVSIAVVTLAVSIGFQQHRVIKERDVAIQERNKFKQTQEFLVGLFEISDPGEARGNNITAREILDRGVEEIQEGLAQQPEAKSELLTTMGVVYRQLGLYDTALPLLQQALDIRKTNFSPANAKVAESYYELGELSMHQGNYPHAEQLLHQALAIYQKVLGENHIKIGDSYQVIGSIQAKKGKYDLAIEYYKKSLAIKQERLGGNHSSVANTYSSLGIVYQETGKYDLAIEFHERALAIKLQTLGNDHPSVASSYHNIGIVYQETGKYDLAIEFNEKSLAIRLNSLDDNHPDIAATYSNLGILYEDKAEYDRAVENYEKSLAIYQKSVGEDHPDVARTCSNLGIVYKEKGEYDKAMEYYEKSLNIRLKSLGNNHPEVAGTYNNLGVVFFEKGEYDKAIEFYEKALAIYLKNLGEEHPVTAFFYANIGEALGRKGEHDQAIRFLEKALPILVKAFGDGHPHVGELYNLFGNVFIKKGEYRQALEYFEKANSINLDKLGIEHPDAKKTENNIAKVKKLMLDNK